LRYKGLPKPDNNGEAPAFLLPLLISSGKDFSTTFTPQLISEKIFPRSSRDQLDFEEK